MFEKEAEEIANKRCHEIMCYGHCSFSSPKHHRCGEWHREYNCAKEGAEFGYNKANEWHFVKDGDLPKDENRVWLYFGVDDYNDGQFIRGRFWCGSCGWFDVEEVIAWKEIVLPKETESDKDHD